MERICGEAPIGLCDLDTDLRYIYINDWLAAKGLIPVRVHGDGLMVAFEDLPQSTARRFDRVCRFE